MIRYGMRNNAALPIDVLGRNRYTLSVECLLVGGGGGGGGTGATDLGSGGGGAGGYLEANVTLDCFSGASYAVTVGGGGSGGSNDVKGSVGQ